MAEPVEVMQVPRAVRDDGTVPFLAPQPGIDPVVDADLVTKGWALANLGGGGGGGAPANADYLVKTSHGDLSAERVVTDTASVVWDWATGGQAKATVPAATTSAQGIVELASAGETSAGLVIQANDARLSDARTPTTHAASHLSGGSDPLAAATTTARGTVELATNGETAANVVVQGNDGRLSDARTPQPHASTHKEGDSDPIQVAKQRLLGNPTGSDPADMSEIPLGNSLTFAGAATLVRAALSGGDVTAAEDDNTLTIGNDAVTNAKAANMAANTIKLRNSGSTGDPGDVKVSALTEKTGPVSGDWLLAEETGGSLRKINAGGINEARVYTGSSTVAANTSRVIGGPLVIDAGGVLTVEADGVLVVI